MRRNAATRTSSQSSNKVRRNTTGCFSGGAEFLLSHFVTVLNKPGTNASCREITDCPQALAACRTSQSSLHMVYKKDLGPGHSGSASVLGKAGSRPRGSFLLSRSEFRNAALPTLWMCPVKEETTER